MYVCMYSALVSLDQRSNCTVRRAGLVLGRATVLAHKRPPRPTQPGRPFVGRRNEYRLWKVTRMFCVALVMLHTDTVHGLSTRLNGHNEREMMTPTNANSGHEALYLHGTQICGWYSHPLLQGERQTRQLNVMYVGERKSFTNPGRHDRHAKSTCWICRMKITFSCILSEKKSMHWWTSYDSGPIRKWHADGQSHDTSCRRPLKKQNCMVLKFELFTIKFKKVCVWLHRFC